MVTQDNRKTQYACNKTLQEESIIDRCRQSLQASFGLYFALAFHEASGVEVLELNPVFERS